MNAAITQEVMDRFVFTKGHNPVVAPYIRPGSQSQQPTRETRDGSREFASSQLEDGAKNAIWTSSLVVINVGQHTSRPVLTYEYEVAHGQLKVSLRLPPSLRQARLPGSGRFQRTGHSAVSF